MNTPFLLENRRRMTVTVRQHIVECLEAHKGEYVSGEELAAGIGVSRAAVWKTIQGLQEEG